jgi:hypothetical protein
MVPPGNSTRYPCPTQLPDGTSNMNRVSSEEDLTVSVPPFASAIWEAMYSPSPLSTRVPLPRKRLEQPIHRLLRNRLPGVPDRQFEGLFVVDALTLI